MLQKILLGIAVVVLVVTGTGITYMALNKKAPSILKIKKVNKNSVSTSNTNSSPKPTSDIKNTDEKNLLKQSDQHEKVSYYSSWKVYQDPQGILSFRYPPGWDLESFNIAYTNIFLEIKPEKNNWIPRAESEPVPEYWIELQCISSDKDQKPLRHRDNDSSVYSSKIKTFSPDTIDSGIFSVSGLFGVPNIKFSVSKNPIINCDLSAGSASLEDTLLTIFQTIRGT